MAEIDTSAEAVKELSEWLYHNHPKVAASSLLEVLLAQRDAAVARAEKAELVNECHCVNVEALTTERDTAEAQLTAALARVAELEGEVAEWQHDYSRCSDALYAAREVLGKIDQDDAREVSAFIAKAFTWPGALPTPQHGRNRG